LAFGAEVVVVQQKVMVIILDSAEKMLIDQWMDDGTLQHLARLREQDTYGALASLTAGPTIQPGSAIDTAHMIDIPPTLFQLLHEPIPSHFGGTPIPFPGLSNV
jgi:predicted AlkP superfamily phosphohydrolase/phosphomutase